MSDNELDTTVDEWRAEMEKFTPAATLSSLPYLTKGKTSGELAKEFKVSNDTIVRRLSEMIKNGRCEKGRAHRATINGQEKNVPVYQLVPKSKAGEK